MDCPHCQGQNPDEYHFCQHCGTLLGDRCPRCHFIPLAEANFCGQCGLGLTPRAQFQWEQLAGKRWVHQPVEPAPRPDRQDRDRPDGGEAGHVAAPAAPAATLLDRYIPQELMAKLEAARARGGMAGERRVVTMLFCDVKGSTAAAQQLDPEDWTEIINGAFEYMIRPVYHYEGIVARLMGDAILAFFGAPIAHEDDPQRAVLAGLDIVSGMKAYRSQVKQQWDIDFNVRVGINTGLVVVGAVGSDLRLEYTAMGDAINLAARMEQTAEPGTVQIAHDTYRLVGQLFEFEPLGAIQVKGQKEPVLAYRVLGRNRAPEQWRARDGLEASLVGRSREMARLETVVSDLTRGIGGIVCLIGRAGLGKSRLIRELKQATGQAPAITWYEAAALSFESAVPYALFRRLIRRLNGISAGDEPAQFWEKVNSLTAHLTEDESARHTRVIAALSGLPDPSGQPPLKGEPFKRELYAVMGAIWERLFTGRPTILVLDDLHWVDPASIDLLLHLLPVVEECPLVLLLAFRPDREAASYRLRQSADAAFHHRYTEINVRPLSAEHGLELINRLLGKAELPESLPARIQDRAAGNPLFIEEVVRALVESGVLIAEDRRENGAVHRIWRATADDAAIDIPDTLQGMLVSRLDQLEEAARQLVQLASVIGRSFYYRVLEIISQVDASSEQPLEQLLSRLVRLELIQEAARVPELEYRFRNPLVHEIAYQTILRRQRRAFHQRVGEVLETLFPDRLAEMADRLAFHFSEGQQADRALAYYTMAGDNAWRLFANREALASYEQALKWAEPGEASTAQLIHLYRRKGRVLELLLRHDEAMATYQELEALGEKRGDDSLRLAGITAQGTAYLVGKSDPENSRRRAEEALALARRLGDRVTEARCLWTLLIALTWYDTPLALEYGEQGLSLADELAAAPGATAEDRDLLALILVDLALAHTIAAQLALALERARAAQRLFEDLENLPMAATAVERTAIVYAAEGQVEQAAAVMAQALALDESIDNHGGLAGKYFNLLVMDIYGRLGDFGRLFATLEAIKPLSAREGKLQEEMHAVYDLWPVVAYHHAGAMEQIADMTEPLLTLIARGHPLFSPLLLYYGVRACILAGNLERGRGLVAKNRPLVNPENLVLPLTADLARVEAELAVADNALKEALAPLESYVDKARQKGMPGYLPAVRLLQGQILLQYGDETAAYRALQLAHRQAVEQRARPVLWQTGALLADMEAERGNLAEAQSLQEQARQAIERIAAHAGRDDLRTAFLARPEVRVILMATGGELDLADPDVE